MQGFSRFVKSSAIKQVSFRPTSPTAGRLRIRFEHGVYDYENVHKSVAARFRGAVEYGGSVGKCYNRDIKGVYGSHKVGGTEGVI